MLLSDFIVAFPFPFTFTFAFAFGFFADGQWGLFTSWQHLDCTGERTHTMATPQPITYGHTHI